MVFKKNPKQSSYADEAQPNKKEKGRLNAKKSASGTTKSTSPAGSGLPGKGRTNPLRSVGGKIFITFFISIVLVVLAVGFISFRISSNVIKDNATISMQQTITQTSERLDMAYRQFESYTENFIFDADLNSMLAEYMAAEMADRISIQRSLDDRVNGILFSDSLIQGIHIIDTKGYVVNSYGNSILERDVSQEEWLAQIVERDGRIQWIDTREKGFSSNTENVFGVGRLIKQVNRNAVVGVVLFEISVKGVSSHLEALQTGGSSEVFITNADGNIVFSFDQDEIGQPLNITLTDEDNIVLDEQGNERLAVSKTTESSNGWTVIGTVLVDELVADASAIFTTTVIVALFSAVLAIIIGFVIARNIGGPLQHLTNLMEEGAEGKLSVRTNFKNKDEIGQLGRSFNQMMEEITNLVQRTNESAQDVLETAARLSDVSKQTAASAKEISVASEQIAGGATTLAAEAERGNELTQGIGERMKSVVESNIEMGQSANDVRLSSEKGAEYMETVIDKTNETEKMTRSMVEKVDKLKESTSSIRKILDMLNNITKQTNILSLNATIEASRAGAAGKGFMVVADEIRKLADQSKESIEIVGEITETIQSEIDETVEVLSEAYPIFQEQTQSVKEADTIFRDVQTQMSGFIEHLDEVTSSVQQLEESQNVLSEAMSNVSAVSQESSATSEEVASLTTEQLKVSDGLVQLSEQLESLSKSLKESLNRFTI